MIFAQARELITPNIRTHMSGYANRTDMFEGIHDDFYVKTLYMENKGTKFLIITYDLCHYIYDLNERVMTYAAEKFEMPYESILVNYSHTHAGPKITSPTEKETPSPLDGFLVERTKSCIDRAKLNSFKGSLQIAYTSGRWNVNRRLETENGFKMKPNHNAVTDDEVVIMTVRDSDNNIRTVMVNYSCHPVTLSGTLYLSAEFPGRISNLLESEYYGSMAFFLQGAAGNMRPLVTADKGSFKACSFDELDIFAKSVAAKVVKTIHSGIFRTIDPEFKCTKFNIDIPVNPLPISVFEERLKTAPGYLKLRLEKVIKSFESIDDFATIHCGIVKLTDDLYIPYMGGEIVYEVKELVRRVFAPADVVFLGYHEALTYIPDDKIINEGGYEGYDAPTNAGFRGPFKKGINDVITNAFKNAYGILAEG